MNIYLPTHKNGKPVRDLKRKPPWRIALIANSKNDFEPDQEDPPDAGAEFDSIKTLQSIAAAMEADGHWVHFLEADYTLPESLINLRPHICFNIAEGRQGNGREAHVPALCELLAIPYTASRVVANAISLDKTHTKRIWKEAGLPTADFIEVSNIKDLKNIRLSFPLFVKPVREGTGMGIDEGSIVKTQEELTTRVKYLLDTYQQPALVEEYLPGREFTVGFFGNPGSPKNRRTPALYDQEGYHWLPIMEIESSCSVSPSVYGHDAKTYDIGSQGAPGYLCPADIPAELQNVLIDLTKRAAQVLDVCDVSRVDFRIGADQKPYLMEINTLPGLNPDLSDLCIMAAVEGISHHTLITEILYLAAERFQMPIPKDSDLPATGIHLPALYQWQTSERQTSSVGQEIKWERSLL